MDNTPRLTYSLPLGDLPIPTSPHKMPIQKNMSCLLENSLRLFLNIHKAQKSMLLDTPWELPSQDKQLLEDKHQTAFSQNMTLELQYQARLKPSSA